MSTSKTLSTVSLPPLAAIIGPTAVGKTEIALQVAERLNGEVVSADSRLFYRGMDIGTAKPTPAELLRVPHHLIDVTGPEHTWSLTMFQQAAVEAIADIHTRGKLPILAGGTGQYLRAVLEGWQPPAQPPDPRLRSALEAWAVEIGADALHERLAVLDPQAAAFIDARNVRRTIRALETILHSGERFSAQRGRSAPPYNVLIIGLTRPRPELYARVDARIQAMLEAGFLDEVRGLMESGCPPDSPALSAIGYREMAAVLRGQMTLDEAVVQIKRLTRRYIRQQGAWFREEDSTIHWFTPGSQTVNEILHLIGSHFDLEGPTPAGLLNSSPSAAVAAPSNAQPVKPWLNHYDPSVPPTLTYPPQRVFDFLDEAARRCPDQTCTIFHGQIVTYAEMAALTDRLAAALCARGLRKGQRVAIMLPNSPQFILAYYAILKTGGVVSAINPNSPAPETLQQLNDAGVSWWIGLHSLYAMILSVRGQTGLEGCFPTPLEDTDLSQWLINDALRLQNFPPLGDDAWLEELVRKPPPETQNLPLVTPDDPAIFQYSGGTTGTPKAAIGLHRNLAANTLQFRHWLAGLEDGKETVLLAIPLYHVYGMVVGMSVGVMLGARLVLVPDPRNLPSVLEAIQTYQASFYPGVPAMYAAINQHADVQAGRYNLRSIRACISGSAPLLSEVRTRFEALTGARLMEGYGLSEAPTATHCNPMLGEKRAGSIGLPLPDVDCRIVSLEDGETELPSGEPGELLIRGPQVMLGYHNQPEETAQTLRGGWLHTGDIARMDEDGYFYIIDRKKDLIKVSGYSVWPREVEEVLASHPDVLEAAAASIPHPARGEVVKIWVVARPGTAPNAQALIAWCKERLVYYKVPVEVEFLERLPRTAVGKLLRRELVNLKRIKP